MTGPGRPEYEPTDDEAAELGRRIAAFREAKRRLWAAGRVDGAKGEDRAIRPDELAVEAEAVLRERADGTTTTDDTTTTTTGDTSMIETTDRHADADAGEDVRERAKAGARREWTPEASARLARLRALATTIDAGGEDGPEPEPEPEAGAAGPATAPEAAPPATAPATCPDCGGTLGGPGASRCYRCKPGNRAGARPGTLAGRLADWRGWAAARGGGESIAAVARRAGVSRQAVEYGLRRLAELEGLGVAGAVAAPGTPTTGPEAVHAASGESAGPGDDPGPDGPATGRTDARDAIPAPGPGGLAALRAELDAMAAILSALESLPDDAARRRVGGWLCRAAGGGG